MTDRPADPTPPTDPTRMLDADDPAAAGPGLPPVGDPPAGPRREKKSWVRRLLVGVLVLIVLLVLLIALAPTLISTPPGTRLAESIASGQINGQVKLTGLSVGWTSGIKLDRAVVIDRADITVVEVANLSTELSLLAAVRQNFDLGSTKLKLNLPIVRVYDDGTTNLHDVFPQLAPSDEPTEVPPFTIDANATVLANVQYVGKRDDASTADDGPAVDIAIDGATLKRLAGQPLEHSIPVALRIAGQDAGRIATTGATDLDTLAAARPTIKADVTITELQLPAVATVAAAFGVTDVDVKGVLNGSVNADVAAGQLGVQLIFAGLNIAPRVAQTPAGQAGVVQQPQGYSTSRLEVALNGSFLEEPLPPDQQKRTADGTLLTTRQVANIQELRVATAEQETLRLGAKVDLFLLQTDAMANWPMLAQGVSLNLQTPYATAQGQGTNLGSLKLVANADAAAVRERFGALVPALQQLRPEGQFTATLATNLIPTPEGGTVRISYDVTGRDVVLQPPPAESEVAFASVQELPPAKLVDPLRVSRLITSGTAALLRPSADTPPGVESVKGMFSALDGEGQLIVGTEFGASGINADTQSVREVVLEGLNLDYARLRTMVGGWAALPEARQPLEAFSIIASASLDGATNTFRLVHPLSVSLGGTPLARVSAAVRKTGATAWEVSALETTLDLAAAGPLIAAFGPPDSPGQVRGGTIVVRLADGRALVIDTTPDAVTQLPNVRGALAVDGSATIVYVGAPGEADDAPPVAVDLTGTQLAFVENVVRHTLPLTLRVGDAAAGSLTATGQLDLRTLDAERPTLSQSVEVRDLQLAAVAAVLSPFGLGDLDLGGTMNGTLAADASTGTVMAVLRGSSLRVGSRADPAGAYESKKFSLDLAGALSADAGTFGLEQLKITTGDGAVTAKATVDVAAMRGDDMLATWPTLARDVAIAVDSAMLTVTGGGATLDRITLDAAGDAGAIQTRFGDFMDLGGLQPEGRFRAKLATRPEGEAIFASYEVGAEDAVLTQAQPGDAAPAPQPLRLQSLSVKGEAVLARPDKDVPPGITSLRATLAAADADGQPLVAGELSASNIDGATGSIGEARVNNLALGDYPRLRQTLIGWVELPEAVGPLEPISINVAATYDGATKTLRLAEPLRVLLGQEELVNVSAVAAQTGETTWQIKELAANANVPAVSRLMEALGNPISAEAPAQGRASVLVRPEAPLSFDTSDPLATMAGGAIVDMKKATVKGLSLTGQIPIVAEKGRLTVPADAPALAANGGEVRLGGTVMERKGDDWILRLPPDAELVRDVSLNNVLMDSVGQYVNFVFTDPESAAGFLGVKLTGGEGLNLSNPMGPGSSLALEFSVRDLAVTNDVIATFADQALGDILGPLQQQASAIPGLDAGIKRQLASFNLSEEIKEEISSIRGNIVDARVELRDGVAQTRITLNLADPRASAAEAGGNGAETFGLAFAGGVNLESLQTQGLSVTVPRNLIEKWVGENPGDLVKVFGDNPWGKILPNGLTVGVNGSTAVPVPDVSQFVRAEMPRIVRAAAQGGIENQIRKGLGDLLDR